ncbi:MAG: sugar transferase [Planctomycetes bacterium]|nr:sugar transferase [Planctomycetota bacterium]
MSIFKFLKPKKLNVGPGAKELKSEIYTEDEFKRIILRERVRCDRGGNSFSLVIFDLSKEGKYFIAKFIKLLNNRGTRLIDEVGMLDQQHIGICLHNTDKSGSLCFAGKIHEKIIASTRKDIPYNTYLYPTDFRDLDNGNGHSNKYHKNNGNSKKNMQNQDRLFCLSDKTERVFAGYVEHGNKLKETRCYKIRTWKRFMDIVLSALTLATLSPFLLIVTIFIKIVSPGPVFFKQERVGASGKTFTMIKFRSMRVGDNISAHKEYYADLINGANSKDGNLKKPMIKQENINRLIPFGHIIRKLCIDELPQLYNVLRGEMSLIGPRPPIQYEVVEYLDWHNGRFDAVPGLTGLWQVSGKNRLTFDQMVRLDIKYSRQESFLLDIKIILKTPIAIIAQFIDSSIDNNYKIKGASEYA